MRCWPSLISVLFLCGGMALLPIQAEIGLSETDESNMSSETVLQPGYAGLPDYFSRVVRSAGIVRGPILEKAHEGGVTVTWWTAAPSPVVGGDRLDSFGSATEFSEKTEDKNLSGLIVKMLGDDGTVERSTRVSVSAVSDGGLLRHSVRGRGLKPGKPYLYIPCVGGKEVGEGFLYRYPKGEGTLRFLIMGNPGSIPETGRMFYEGSVKLWKNYESRWDGLKSTDALMMLGNLAYPRFDSNSADAALFHKYERALAKLPIWPVFGTNETPVDGGSAVFDSCFETPEQGECGGLPSREKRYYSFDYNHIHFVVLNTECPDLKELGGEHPMLQWLRQDLMASRATWKVVLMHRSLYTRGRLDSDSDGISRLLRELLVPVFDQSGVDLVLSAQSEVYERSFLLQGHTGISSTLGKKMILQKSGGSTGTVDDKGKFRSLDVLPEQGIGFRKKAGAPGAVYATIGSSGLTGSWAVGSSGKKSKSGSSDSLLPSVAHPVMQVSLRVLGALVLESGKDSLHGSFIDSEGRVRDDFIIVKD